MKNYVFLLFFVILASKSTAQSCHCDSIFVKTQQIVEQNYAGWFDKVTDTNQADYAQWTARYHAISKIMTTAEDCASLLKDWIGYFRDKHLQIKHLAPEPTNGAISSPEQAVEILTSSQTPEQIRNYLATHKNLDPIEGIYENQSYTLGLMQVRPGLFYATILATSNENWKVGEVKLTIQKVADHYTGVFYEGDKSGQSQHPVQLVDNILDFDIVFFEKTSPEPSVKRDIVEYEITKDSYAPRFTFRGKELAILSFKSFENNTYEQTEYLLGKYAESLAITPYWIIDLRNNSGGNYQVGMLLLDYFYTQPIVRYNSERRMTPQNFELWFNTFIKASYEGFDEPTRKQWDVRLAGMKARFGTFYNGRGTATDTLTVNQIKPFPHKIALLVDSNTVSSGELFTMLARQSQKVTVLGTNTGGMMDYGNVVTYQTSCPVLRIQLPMERELWLDTGFSVDKNGLKPDYYLQGDDWIEQAYQLLKK